MAIALGSLALHLSATTPQFRYGLPLVRGQALKQGRQPLRGQALKQSAKARFNWALIALLVVSGNAADLDFGPGFLIGDINRWHHTASHSLLACLIWGLAVWVLCRWLCRTKLDLDTTAAANRQAFWIAVSASVAYASHLLLDWLTQDTRPPLGIPLLWPIDLYSLSDWTPLGGVRHGVPGDTVWVVLGEIFSLHNAKAAAREALLVAPVYLALLMFVRSSSRRTEAG